jgi:DNA repair exonuclease SbcCD nuclease subunit
MELRILHTADLHYRDKDIEECRKVSSHLCTYALNHGNLDLIVIAGDMTDRNDVKFDSATARLVMETVSYLSMAAPVLVLTGTKFHDGNIPELMQGIERHHQIYVSNRPEQIVLDNGEFYTLADGVNVDAAKFIISTMPAPTKQFFDSLDGIEATDQAIGQAMTSIFAQFGETAGRLGLPHILVGHWQVGGAYVSETQQLIGRDIEVSVDQVLSARPTVACLGHIHKAQEIGSHPIFYSGSAYRKDFGELDTKGFYVHTIEDNRLIGSEFIEAPTRKLIKVAHDYTVKDIDTELMPLIKGYSDEDAQGAHIRVEFKIWQDQRDRIDKEKLRGILLNLGAAEADIQVVTVPRQNVRAARVLQVERLRDKVQARAEIVGDTVPESILEKCDAIEAESRDEIMKKIKRAA